MKRLMLLLAVLALTVAPAAAQDVVKIGQIEAQTGANATYGWMSSQGSAPGRRRDQQGRRLQGRRQDLQARARSLSTRAAIRKEATVQLKQLLEEDKVKFVFGPFLTNVFNGVEPYAAAVQRQVPHDGRSHPHPRRRGHAGQRVPDAHVELGRGRERLRRAAWSTTWSRPRARRRSPCSSRTTRAARSLEDIYVPMFKQRASRPRWTTSSRAPRTSPPSSPRSPPASPTTSSRAIPTAVLYDIVRQATETGQLKKFFLVRGSLGPGLKNKDHIDDYIVYVPKYFEEAEKTEPKVAKFVEAYKAFYKTRLPVRPGAAVLVVLLRPRLHAGRGDEEGRHGRRRRQGQAGAACRSPTTGMWKIRYRRDRRGGVRLRRRPPQERWRPRGPAHRSQLAVRVQSSRPARRVQLRGGGAAAPRGVLLYVEGAAARRRSSGHYGGELTQLVLGQLLNGAIVGTIYGIIALGVTLTFGITGIVNFALGAFMMLGCLHRPGTHRRGGLSYPVAVVPRLSHRRRSPGIAPTRRCSASPATTSSTACWSPSG